MLEHARTTDGLDAPEIGPNQCRDGEDERLLRLLTATASGDTRAFKQLYDLTSRCLMVRALAILRQREAAEDIVQEAYVRIWTNAAKFDSKRGYVMGWLIRVLRNTAIDRLRRERILARYVQYVDELPDSLATVDPIEDRMTLGSALGILSREHMSVVRRVVMEGWTHGEVSLQDGVPTPTTKARAQRGLKRMRAVLTQDISVTGTLPKSGRASA
ncbi:MAG: sigma-70 family RNA polymerase sigma factor [Caulobacter sp.]|nr:sigma-70 family RNA polymerase sigma factor [Caulobacter sp.]